MEITKDIKYIGVNDHDIDLFEGQYAVPAGMAYNSYVIKDEKIAVMDTVDAHFGEQWLANLRDALDGRAPDYLVVQHMEPDHSANIAAFAQAYPDATIVASAKAFTMMKNFFGTDYAERRTVVGDGDTLPLGWLVGVDDAAVERGDDHAGGGGVEDATEQLLAGVLGRAVASASAAGHQPDDHRDHGGEHARQQYQVGDPAPVQHVGQDRDRAPAPAQHPEAP